MLHCRDYSDLANTIGSNLFRLPNDISLIAGVPRSGLVPASIIGLAYNKPVTSTDALTEGRGFSSGARGAGRLSLNSFENARLNILVVDDSICSGKQLELTKARLAEVAQRHNIYYLCIYGSPLEKTEPDFCFEVLPENRIFAWNVLHSWITPYACVDIDGVLCRDPGDHENDDSQNYLEFVNCVYPLIKPTHKINSLVTCRLEKYRGETEAWLSRNGIEHERLFMMHYSTMEERANANRYGEYKAEVFDQTGCQIFIESSLSQSRTIASLSEKPVFCIETQSFIVGDSKSTLQQVARRKLRITSLLKKYASRIAAKPDLLWSRLSKP